MSDRDAYNACYDAFMAIPENEVREPNMPVDICLQEAENQYQFCIPDKEKLMAAGLSETLIDAVPDRAGALRIAEAMWFTERNSKDEAEKEWEIESAKANDLLNYLQDAFRYAFRNDNKLLAKVAEIEKGNSQADLVQDLKDTSVLGEKHSGLLTEINLDLTLLTTSASLSGSLAGILARVNGEKGLKNETKIIRDRAYTYLKEAVDEVRACGRFVFRNDPKRLKGYRSNYHNKK